MKCSLGISHFLEKLSSLSHSIVFLYFFQWSLRKAFLSLFAILWNSAFKWIYLSFSPLPLSCPLFSAICKPSSGNHGLFAFLFLGDDLDHSLLYTVMHRTLYVVHKHCNVRDIVMSQISARSSSGTLSIRSNPWITLSLPLYNRKGFDLSHTCMV